MAITLNGTTGITTPDVDSTDLTATGNFTSRGIDDNATSTAMTLDSSGNVGIGTSSLDNKVNIQESPLSGRSASNSNTSLTLEHATDTGIQFFSATQTQLRFGDAASTGAGSIIYEHGSDILRFATNSSEQCRIDSSGNLLVNKTSQGVTSTGSELGLGWVAAARSNDAVAYFNRQTSDGDIAKFYKDGSNVGSIGAEGNDITIDGGVSNHSGLRFSSPSILPRYNGALADNQVDLGQTGSNYRFKDLYLSGGVYLGGTGSANKLDDYEEGTWTANLHAPPDSLTNLDATEGTNRYTKVGNFVTVQGKITLSANSTSSSALRLSGLPFTSSSNVAITGSLICRNGASFSFVPYAFSNSTEVHFYQISPSGNWNQVSYNEVGALEMHFEISYFAT